MTIAAGEPYFTPAEYREYLDKQNTTGNDSDSAIRRSALATADYIDHYTRRNFRLLTNQTKTYTPAYRTFMQIDDWANVTSTLPAGVTLERQNPTWPFEFLKIDPKYHYYTITITGDIGWTAVPAGVEECALELTAVFRLQSTRSYAQVSSQQQAATSGQKPTTTEIAQMLVEQYLQSYQRIEVLE